MLDLSTQASLASSTANILENNTVTAESVQDSDSSRVRFMVGGQSHSVTACHPDVLKQKYAETEDKMNTEEYRICVREVTGAPPNEEPNNNQV